MAGAGLQVQAQAKAQAKDSGPGSRVDVGDVGVDKDQNGGSAGLVRQHESEQL